MILTLLPISWMLGRPVSVEPREAIAYRIVGLPANEMAVIAIAAGGWRVVRETLTDFDQSQRYPMAEEAAAALKAWIEQAALEVE